jgi:hypothetical protein
MLERVLRSDPTSNASHDEGDREEEIVKAGKIHRDNHVVHGDLTEDEDEASYEELDTESENIFVRIHFWPFYRFSRTIL